MTVNSVFSSAAGAAAAPPPAAAAAGAAIVTPNLDLNASISSASSNTDMLPMASRMSSLLMVCVAIVFSLTLLSGGASGALILQRLQGADHRIEQPVQDAQEPGPRRLERAAQRRQQLLLGRQRSERLHLRLRDRLPLDQPDPDGGLLEFLGEIGQHFHGADRIGAREHQRRRTGEMPLEPALLELLLGQGATRQRVLDHHVLDAHGAEPAAAPGTTSSRPPRPRCRSCPRGTRSCPPSAL